jgi:hypothetical protein
MRAHCCWWWGRWSGGWRRCHRWSGQPRWGLVEGGMHSARGKHAHHCRLYFLEGLRELWTTRLSIATFFWIDALVRLLSNAVIWHTWCSSSAALAPNAASPPHHAVDAVHFGKGCCPMGFPVLPGVVGNGLTIPLAPGHSHVAPCKCMLCPGGDHGGLGNGYRRIKCKHLATFLLPCVDG